MAKERLSILILLLPVFVVHVAEAWIIACHRHSISSSSSASADVLTAARRRATRDASNGDAVLWTAGIQMSSGSASSSAETSSSSEPTESAATPTSQRKEDDDDDDAFTDDEIEFIEDLYARGTQRRRGTTEGENNDDSSGLLERTLLEALPTMHPKLVLKLRRAGASNNDDIAGDVTEAIREVSSQLNKLLESRLEEATQTLKALLDAGEIRKLDSLIGKAGREGKLDVAFFNVLTVNIQDAARSEATMAPAGGESLNADGEGSAAASRYQILQHVYTRCQEEVEKNLPPGTALLNKLLRTEQPGIRSNLYKHYLTPQPNVITAPDGKEVDLGTKPVLVALPEFIDAMAKAVEQIRTVEKSGGTDRESAALMVESCRQIAKEARITIGESYGRDSKELSTLEEGLQPVFRPTSAKSPYIQGQQ